MSGQNKNKIRSLILLLVFSLNTVTGFACSIGLDLGYNKTHHQHDDTHTVQIKPKTADTHKHDHGPTFFNKENGINVSDNDVDCCSKGVTDFIKLDKAVTSFTGIQSPIFFIAFVAQFLLPDQDHSTLDTSHFGLFRRSWYFHDDTDLRIVIQSFQI
jgi:hypothetical protein